MELTSPHQLNKEKNDTNINQIEPISNESKEENEQLVNSDNGNYLYNCKFSFLLFSFLFSFSCFFDIYIILDKNKNYDILLYILRIVTDALNIFPIFCFLGSVNYKGNYKINISFGVLTCIPQMIMNIITVVLLFIGEKNEDNNTIWLCISTISNSVFFIILFIITILKLVKT